MTFSTRTRDSTLPTTPSAPVAWAAPDHTNLRPPAAWLLALRQLRRDFRAGELRLLLLAVALAVGALSAVGFFADRLQGGGHVIVSSFVEDAESLAAGWARLDAPPAGDPGALEVLAPVLAMLALLLIARGMLYCIPCTNKIFAQKPIFLVNGMPLLLLKMHMVVLRVLPQ